MDGNRPVAAVPVFQATGEGAFLETDAVNRHPGQLVNAPSGIAVYQYRVHKRGVLVLPEQQHISGKRGTTSTGTRKRRPR